MDDARDSNSDVVMYRFCRVVFGLNASPFLLNGTIRHHLATFAEADPKFVKKMVDSFYVDDLIWFRVTAQLIRRTIYTTKRGPEWQTEGLDCGNGKPTTRS